MWHFYCLPGRVITEIGYLFPKPGQLWATKRRRESGFAAFLFATIFWALALPFLLPLVVAIASLPLHGLGTAAWPQHTSTTSQAAQPARDGPLPPADLMPPVSDASPVTSTAGPRALPADETPRPARETPRPRPVFSPRHAVVQAVDEPPGPATQTCSATVTDHCIER